MSQVDTGPTILGLLGYAEPYVSMGTDVLSLSPGEEHYAIYKGNNLYHIISTHLLVEWDGQRDTPVAVFDITSDAALEHPLDLGADEDAAAESAAIIDYAKAYLQDFTHRLTTNTLHLSR